jgi:hypothetical protein
VTHMNNNEEGWTDIAIPILRFCNIILKRPWSGG